MNSRVRERNPFKKIIQKNAVFLILLVQQHKQQHNNLKERFLNFSVAFGGLLEGFGGGNVEYGEMYCVVKRWG